MFKVDKFDDLLKAELVSMAKLIGLNEEQTNAYILSYKKQFEENKQNYKTNAFRHNGTVRNTNYFELLDKLVDKNTDGIVFGTNGAVYKAPDSPAKSFLKLMMSRRKVAKKEMLKAKSDGDTARATMLDVQQLKFKESANSLYGLLNLKAFFLYCPISANAITSASRNQAYYIINNFECTIGKRFVFETFADVITFLNKNTSEYVSLATGISQDKFLDAAKKEAKFNYLETVEEFIDKIKKGFQFKTNEQELLLLKTIVSGIFENESDKHKFSLMGKMKDLFENSVTIDKSIEYNHFPEKENEENQFSEKDWHNFCEDLLVVCSYITLYSLPEAERIAKNYDRTVTVLSDTDSTYNQYDSLFEYVLNHKNSINLTLQEKEVIGFRLVDSISKRITDASLRELNKQILKSNDDVNSWKGEFCFRTIIIPSTKKNYAYHAVVQEGYTVDFKENKGFFKSGFSEFSNNFIVRIIETIFESDKAKMYYNIFKEFTIGRKHLEDSIANGKSDSFSRLKVGHKSKYADAWAQYQYVAGAVNNLIYNDNKALAGERVSFVKLKTVNCPPKEENRTEFFLNDLEKKAGKEFRDKIEIILSQEPEFKTWFEKDGLKSIGIPTSAERIPEEIIPLIDKELIISENLFSRTGNFLELLGIESGKGSLGVYGGGALAIKEYL